MRRQGDKLVVRCYAYPAVNDDRKQGYYAVCLDLDLVTWKPTWQAAVASLNADIKGYLECITTEQEARDLLPRPAPFWPYHVQWYAVKALCELSRYRRQLSNFWTGTKDLDLSRLSHATA